MPYDQDTSIGYAVTLVIEILAVWKFCGVFCSSNTFFMSVCSFTETFIYDIQLTVNELDELNKKRIIGGSNEIALIMKSKFVDLMELHVEILK